MKGHEEYRSEILNEDIGRGMFDNMPTPNSILPQRGTHELSSLIIELILGEVKAQGLSVAELSRRSGVSSSYIAQIKSKSKPLNFKTIDRLLQSIDCTIDASINRNILPSNHFYVMGNCVKCNLNIWEASDECK